MDTKPIDNLVAEKLEMIPEVIQVTLHRHDEQFTEAKEAFETGYIYEALDATAVTNGEPLYNLFFFATLPGADNLVRFKRFDEEADLRRVGIKMCAKSIDEFTKGFRLFANASRQQGLFDLGVDLLTNPELIKRPDFRYSKIAYDAMRQTDGSSGAFCMGYLTAKHLSESFPPATIPTLAETFAKDI